MPDDSRTVLVVGPWNADGTMRTKPVTLYCSWFASHYTIERHELMEAESWADMRLLIEGRMRHQIEELMRRTGFVPVGEVITEQTEDLLRNATKFVMRQRGMESDSPVWIQVREALAEDRAALASLRQHREDVGPTDETQ